MKNVSEKCRVCGADSYHGREENDLCPACGVKEEQRIEAEKKEEIAKGLPALTGKTEKQIQAAEKARPKILWDFYEYLEVLRKNMREMKENPRLRYGDFKGLTEKEYQEKYEKMSQDADRIWATIRAIHNAGWWMDRRGDSAEIIMDIVINEMKKEEKEEKRKEGSAMEKELLARIAGLMEASAEDNGKRDWDCDQNGGRITTYHSRNPEKSSDGGDYDEWAEVRATPKGVSIRIDNSCIIQDCSYDYGSCPTLMLREDLRVNGRPDIKAIFEAAERLIKIHKGR